MTKFNLKQSLKLSGVFRVAGVVALVLSSSLAQAGREGYDFSDFSLGSQCHVGNTASAKHSVATLRQFYVNQNQPSQQANQVAGVVSWKIPGGGAPSLQ
ncbi:MAG: hypothetical protein OEV70_04930 [Nitrospirota bacterium]|jgi:hypothetical protein|nr:hypothetical protein [Nitrospirota bacterium]MDH5297345.1 hypothetical protein [Nitrospirota bacterium]